jgi:hypothetical protein
MDQVVTYPLVRTPAPIRHPLLPQIRGTITHPTSDTQPTSTGDDSDLWTGVGPPPSPTTPGIGAGDTYIDLATGDVYQLDQ